MGENTKKNYKLKILRKLMLDKDLLWKDVERITGFTRQNIDYAFKNNYQKTIDKVFEKIQSV
ncbi:hypothetical protein [Pseudoleptotrichia goodfellowii]|uniref:Transcriptional regulator n=1 Tax=Pseudoleptotrichia goodfellowii TaxID=157692 RepID=A0A510J8M4_9FUSO|nr:hypothetical protein [Pseudoleptotrichia goodfellowii]BBM35416.1 hypothetical protein JCM16774_0328 [Pseudoleptotrichia goodfellowii]